VAIDDLFAIDAEARARNLDLEARHALRVERAPALLEIVRQRVEAARTQALPASKLARAANYTLTLWPKLTRFLDHPELELSNNLAENSMRGSLGAARIGSTWGAGRRVQRWRRSRRWWKRADEWELRRGSIWGRCCRA